MAFIADRLKVALIFFISLKILNPSASEDFRIIEAYKKYATGRKGNVKAIRIN